MQFEGRKGSCPGSMPDQTDISTLLRLALLELKGGSLPSVPILTLLLSKARCTAAGLVQQTMQGPDADIFWPVLQLLGIGMVVASFVLKVPQILAIANSGSAAGLSLLAFELEEVGLSIHTAYGFLLGLPFNAFGEVLVCY